MPGNAMVLGQVADLLATLPPAGRQPQQLGPAARGADNSQQDLDERGLAGSVGAQQAKDFAVTDRKTHPGKRLDAPPAQKPVAIHLAQILDVEGGGGCHFDCSLTAEGNR